MEPQLIVASLLISYMRLPQDLKNFRAPSDDRWAWRALNVVGCIIAALWIIINILGA